MLTNSVCRIPSRYNTTDHSNARHHSSGIYCYDFFPTVVPHFSAQQPIGPWVGLSRPSSEAQSWAAGARSATGRWILLVQAAHATLDEFPITSSVYIIDINNISDSTWLCRFIRVYILSMYGNNTAGLSHVYIGPHMALFGCYCLRINSHVLRWIGVEHVDWGGFDNIQTRPMSITCVWTGIVSMVHTFFSIREKSAWASNYQTAQVYTISFSMHVTMPVHTHVYGHGFPSDIPHTCVYDSFIETWHSKWYL